MTEGPWDGSDLPPQHVLPVEGTDTPEQESPPEGGGGGGDMPLDPRSPTARPQSGLHVDEWPDLGVKPALGGLTI